MNERSNAFLIINETNCTVNSTEDCIQNIGSIPFSKFSFFTNGTLYQLFKPAVIETFVWNTLTDSIRQFCPVLSQHNYNKSNKIEEDSNKNESIERNVKIQNGTTELQEYTLNKGGFNELNISDSYISTKLNTIVNNSIKKISSVSSFSQCSFKNTIATLEDIPIQSQGALNDFKESTQPNILTSQFDWLSTEGNTSFSLHYSKIEPNTTSILKNISETITFSLLSEKEKIEENRLKQLSKFPFKEYKKDISKIPNEINLLRLLEMESFLIPIELSYSIFKLNLLGLQMGLSVVITSRLETDQAALVIVLTNGHIQLEVVSLTVKTDILAILSKASNIVHELSSKVIKLSKEVEEKFNKTGLMELTKEAELLQGKLKHVYDIGLVLINLFIIFPKTKYRYSTKVLSIQLIILNQFSQALSLRINLCQIK